MEAAEDDARRLKFFGLDDAGTFWQAERLLTVLRGFDPSSAPHGVNDIVELANAALFVHHDLLPLDISEAEKQRFRAVVPAIRRSDAQLFTSITDSNFAEVVSRVWFDYHEDVLNALAKYKLFDRCDAQVVLTALLADGFHLGELLASRALVRNYDHDVRNVVLSSSRSAELILSKHLLAERQAIHLPASLTPADCRQLLDAYLDSAAANPNYVQLLANARPIKQIGLDPKLKLKARRTHDAFIQDFFTKNTGAPSGVEVSLSDTQTEDVVCTQQGMHAKFSYSTSWLADNLDYPTILNNFIYVFEWVTANQLLTFPSYRSELGVVSRLMMSGKDEYVTGAAFRVKNVSSLLQLHMYRGFLQAQGVELEAVLAWFFSEYLAAEFGAHNFKFRPSSPSAPYLQKCRHLFSEMESVLKQFSLYVDDGELDLELLAMTSEQLNYADLPSTVPRKYVLVTDEPNIQNIQDFLFSDQAHLGYIREQLRGRTLVELLEANTVAYSDFHEYQRPGVNHLIEQGILTTRDGNVTFSDRRQLLVLKDLWSYDATSYWHYSPATRLRIDDMVAKGWLEQCSTLLTTAEVEYINYYLNQKGPSGGPDLRNRYLHGSQADYDNQENPHFDTYLIALRLLIAFVLKLNDDLVLASTRLPPETAEQQATDSSQGTVAN